jgi:hypothetical protein
MALMEWATPVLQREVQSAANSEIFCKSEKLPNFGSTPATRDGEAGIMSNRGTASHGEYQNIL